MKEKVDLKKIIRNIPDFPKSGILFRDITTLLSDKDGFKYAVDSLCDKFKDKSIDAVVAVEARGFILGGAIAYKLGVGFIPVRKKGKLPWKTKSVTYALEYGTDTLQIHEDALKPGSRVLFIDDLLATGGTVKAVTELVEAQGAKVEGIGFVIDLVDLGGRAKLSKYHVVSLVEFEGE
jgi:adenine phosphoribosyltransferase